MANNDYWAYLRSSNELKHSGVKGMKWGFSSDRNYTPIGQKAKGIIDAAGNYIYNAAKGVRNFTNNIGANLGRGVANAKKIGSYIRNKLASIRGNMNGMSNFVTNYRAARNRELYGENPGYQPKAGSGGGGKRAYDDETGEYSQQAMDARARGAANYNNYSVGAQRAAAQQAEAARREADPYESGGPITYQSFMERKRAEEAEEERKRRMAKMAQYMQY